MTKISILMPSLNVGQYIKKCLESVRQQTFKDIEILIIDAGSEDDTLAIVSAAAENDARIRLVKSDKKSYGYQINLGISYAKGDYIGIVETDDFIAPDMYKSLYDKICETDADFVKGYALLWYKGMKGYDVFFPTNNFAVQNGYEDKVINTSQMPDLLLEDRFIWLGLYKKEFLKEIRMNESSGAAFQDQGFLLKTLSKAKSAVYINKPIYYYRQDNNNSSIHNVKSVKFIFDEYVSNVDYVKTLNNKWISTFYIRLFQQIIGRFNEMAYTGEYWGETDVFLDDIIQMLASAINKGILTVKNMGHEQWNILNTLMQNRLLLYKKIQEEKNLVISEVKFILNRIGNRNVVIFGCNRLGIYAKDLLMHFGINVVLFCDNKETLHNKLFNDIPTVSPLCAATSSVDNFFVISGSKYAGEMTKQLLSYNVDIEKIIVLPRSFGMEPFRVNINKYQVQID